MNSYQLYRNRTLTDNVNLVFDFVGENWRNWFKMMAYFLLPFSVLLGTALATIDFDIDTFSMAYVVYIILLFAGCAVVTALQILLVQWHETHGGTLDGCSVATMWRMLPRASLKCLGAIAMCMVCPIMLLEPKDSLTNNLKRAFALGHKKWGRLILITLIMGVVSLLINNTIFFPMVIYSILDSTFEFSKTNSIFWSFLMDVFEYVTGVAQCFIIFVEMGLFVLAMTYYYGSVATEVEDIGLESDIDNFSNLK